MSSPLLTVQGRMGGADRPRAMALGAVTGLGITLLLWLVLSGFSATPVTLLGTWVATTVFATIVFSRLSGALRFFPDRVEVSAWDRSGARVVRTLAYEELCLIELRLRRTLHVYLACSPHRSFTRLTVSSGRLLGEDLLDAIESVITTRAPSHTFMTCDGIDAWSSRRWSVEDRYPDHGATVAIEILGPLSREMYPVALTTSTRRALLFDRAGEAFELVDGNSGEPLLFADDTWVLGPDGLPLFEIECSIRARTLWLTPAASPPGPRWELRERAQRILDAHGTVLGRMDSVPARRIEFDPPRHEVEALGCALALVAHTTWYWLRPASSGSGRTPTLRTS